MNAPTNVSEAGSRIAPGVYFNMPEAVYHADPALGSGSVRALAKCAMYYWQDSWMNPLRQPRAETDALRDGRALHKLVLEGAEAFKRSFRRTPEIGDHPAALDTVPQIKEALRACGQKMTGNKPELIERLREADPGAIFWDDIERDFNAECQRAGACALRGANYDQIVSAAAAITSDSRVAAAFQGGRAEISVFWEDDGVPLKARFDYTRLGSERGRTIGIISDLKRFANQNDQPPERAVITALAALRLDVQAALYLEGAAQMSAFIREGRMSDAGGISEAWLLAIAALQPEDWRWYWCFHEANASVSLLRSTRPKSQLIDGAGVDLSRALQAYRDNCERFGIAWRFVDPMPDTEIDLSDLPKWVGN